MDGGFVADCSRENHVEEFRSEDVLLGGGHVREEIYDAGLIMEDFAQEVMACSTYSKKC